MSEVANAAGAANRLWTVPNVLSLLRLASVPVFVWLFVSDRENAAVVLYAVGAWTDFFDGVIARRFDQVSELGKLLDPLADRILILALALALVARDVMPLWLAVTVVGRDLLILSVFPYLERRKVPRLAVNFTGKSATASLLMGLTLLAYSETTFPAADAIEPAGTAFTVLGAVLYWVAAVMYARQARAGLRALTAGDRPRDDGPGMPRDKGSP
ncbi:MAG: CDP-alcohol phosphatidyltransferase family protein [Actinomycetota bacterium]|nr:CDP-alcohol phosphatidyltransferase family protein [Actinomycetota bacterium]